MIRRLVLVICVGATAANAAAELRYNRDIRPILSDNCFYCHGNDPSHRKAKLRLDVRESALEKEAFVPGKPSESELVKRIFAKSDDDLMPPPESHKALTKTQKETLRTWIAQGAKYEPHWAYAAPVKADVPAGVNAIDHLVAARLKEVGLKPAPEADRRTLIRRLHADLTGLPPTPEGVAAFVADKAPDACERLVDRLMADPHFGERMAIGWLDVVRFADTIGYHSDNPRNVYPYRDWVIRSFNANKRFDRFTIEQLAGDLLPDANVETRVGSAFNRLLLTTEEGGAQAKDYEQRMLADRVRAVGTAWLGQTIGCTQCHDHKFDPITTRDFYSLGAFFADIKEKVLEKNEKGMLVPDEAQARELARLDAELTRARQAFETSGTSLTAAQAKWETAARSALDEAARWTVLKPSDVASKNGATLKIQKDGAILASGKNPDTDSYTVTFTGAVASIAGLRLEALPHDSLPVKGSGRAGNGNFVVSEVVAVVTRADGSVTTQEFAAAVATIEQTFAGDKNPYGRWGAAGTIDHDVKGAGYGWAILPDVTKPQQLVLKFAQAFALGGGDRLNVLLHQRHDAKNHTLGHFRLAVTADPELASRVPGILPSDDVAKILTVAADKRTAEQQAKLTEAFRATAPELAAEREALERARKAKDAFEEKLPRCLVSERMEPKRVVRILPRGNWMDETGEIVRPALPHYLPQPARTDTNDLTRLDLARWLVARENPLTARTFVNRLWRQFFGTALSKVPSDLGAQGELPPNQPLLDWLACEFMDSGWDVKRLVRLIVTSETYRRSSVATSRQLAADPYNRELARQSAFRLDAELVRDGALSYAGLLASTIGGPSVKPYQPDGYWENLNFPKRTYAADAGEAQYRRGLYVWWQRSFLHPSLLAFDAPTREECAAERTRSNIPQQALVLLNDPTYVEAARVLAARILAEGGTTTESRLAWVWQRVLQREPRRDEAKTVSALLQQHLAAYQLQQDAAKQLLGTGLAPLAPGTDVAELAAWTHVARVLLNLHETVTRS